MEFGRSPDEIEHNRKAILIGLFAVAGSLFLIPLGTYSLFTGRAPLGLFLLANSVFCISLMVYSRVTGAVDRVSGAFAVQAGILALFLVLHGGVQGSGVYFAFPLILMMVMAGFRSMSSSVLISLVFLAAVAVGLYGPFPGVHAYEGIHRSRILMGSSALFIMALISEWIRTRSYLAITHTTERLSADAFHDALTGLLNRRGLEHAVQDMQPGDFPAALAIIDIDHFKETNDAHGHEAGDQALVHLGEHLRNSIKGRDLACRWGGEEFLVLFTQTSPHDACRVLEKIREEVAVRAFSHGDNRFRLTFSAGLAEFPERSAFGRALGQADQRLYQAKQNGRNRVVRD